MHRTQPTSSKIHPRPATSTYRTPGLKRAGGSASRSRMSLRFGIVLNCPSYSSPLALIAGHAVDSKVGKAVCSALRERYGMIEAEVFLAATGYAAALISLEDSSTNPGRDVTWRRAAGRRNPPPSQQTPLAGSCKQPDGIANHVPQCLGDVSKKEEPAWNWLCLVSR